MSFRDKNLSVTKILKEYWFVPTAIVIILAVNIIGIRVSFTVGDSMYPTLKSGQVLIINTKNKSPERGDIVVFKTDKYSKVLIKRVIGLPGEKILIKNNNIYINNKIIKDYVDIDMKNYGVLENEILLKENEYFAMGDNRNNSYDCRDIGPITSNEIIGVKHMDN